MGKALSATRGLAPGGLGHSPGVVMAIVATLDRLSLSGLPLWKPSVQPSMFAKPWNLRARSALMRTCSKIFDAVFCHTFGEALTQDHFFHPQPLRCGKSRPKSRIAGDFKTLAIRGPPKIFVIRTAIRNARLAIRSSTVRYVKRAAV